MNMLTQPNPRVALTLLMLSAALPLPAAPKRGAQATPDDLGGYAQGVQVDLPDPKLPGRPLCHVDASAATGQSAANGFLGTMTRVTATLYRQGRPAAILYAPRAQGSVQGKSTVITGTGGVFIKSLLHPGTTIRSNTMVWKAATNGLVASGHVVFTDGKTHLTIRGPRATADTVMQTVKMGPSHFSGSL